jgi:hypothetical protein
MLKQLKCLNDLAKKLWPKQHRAMLKLWLDSFKTSPVGTVLYIGIPVLFILAMLAWGGLNFFGKQSSGSTIIQTNIITSDQHIVPQQISHLPPPSAFPPCDADICGEDSTNVTIKGGTFYGKGPHIITRRDKNEIIEDNIFNKDDSENTSNR